GSRRGRGAISLGGCSRSIPARCSSRPTAGGAGCSPAAAHTATPRLSPGEVDDRQVEGKLVLPRLRLWEPFAVTGPRAVIVGMEEGLRHLTVVLEAVDHIGKAVAAQHSGAVHHVDVQVRGVGVAGVAQESELLALRDLVSLLHLQRSLLEVGVEDEDAVTEV